MGFWKTAVIWATPYDCNPNIAPTFVKYIDAIIFPRIYMPVWQQIKVRTEWLLDSFEIGELNDGKL